jgi:hypothetical protein
MEWNEGAFHHRPRLTATRHSMHEDCNTVISTMPLRKVARLASLKMAENS